MRVLFTRTCTHAHAGARGAARIQRTHAAARSVLAESDDDIIPLPRHPSTHPTRPGHAVLPDPHALSTPPRAATPATSTAAPSPPRDRTRRSSSSSTTASTTD
eukprot:4944255-Pleurochrysis_carterae.AAC.1